MIIRFSYPTGKPPKYPPGVLMCKHCMHVFYRKPKQKKCPNCKKPHGNQQAR